MTEPRTVQHFIDGAFVDSLDGATFDSISPIDNAVVATVAEGSAADADRAVEAARRAFDDGPWPRMSPAQRRAIIHRAADVIESRLEELASWETRDMGKPIAECRTKDVPRTAYNFRFFADFAEQAHTEAFPKPWDKVLTYTLREPVGVSACISPWNFPMMLESWKVAPALAFGNTVVLKPAEQSPVTASLLAECFAEAGLPDGVLNVVQGFGPDAAGERLTTHPGVDLVTFTGESATGRIIMGNAAKTLKRVSFELGGKSASIVMADADMDLAVRGTIDGIFRNQGEVCLAGSRLLVQRSVYDEFLERYVAAAESLVVGDPRDPATQIGPLVSTEHLDKVMSYVELGQARGREADDRRLPGHRRRPRGRATTSRPRCSPTSTTPGASPRRRSSARCRSSCPSTPSRRRSSWPTRTGTASRAWSGPPTSTPRTASRARCGPGRCGSTASSCATSALPSAA